MKLNGKATRQASKRSADRKKLVMSALDQFEPFDALRPADVSFDVTR